MRRSVSIRDLEQMYMYVDDMAVLCDSMDAMEELSSVLAASCLGMG